MRFFIYISIMLDIDNELWPEYYRLLNGKVLINGLPVPVYDGFMSLNYNTTDNYRAIIWNQSNSAPRNNSCNFEGNVSATIEVTCGYREVWSFQECDDMTNQVLKLLCPFDVKSTYQLPSFQIVSALLQNSNRLQEQTPTHYEYRRLLRINHIYSQNVIA